MIKLPMVLLFTAMTALFWGVYGILLHQGTENLGHSSVRAFIGVGIAYFLIAVLVPVAVLSSKKEKGHWSLGGVLYSLFAGSVGALGALGVILAVAFKGLPIYVMPIVFGSAPVVNTLVTSWLNKSFSQIKPLFMVGLVLVAIGAVGVLINKPVPKKALATAVTSSSSSTSSESSEKVEDDASKVKETTKTKESTSKDHGNEVAADPIKIGAAICLAVFCWGAYGPFLHIGQMKMGGSRLRPFCCVGIAYFVIAVAVPVMILMGAPDNITLDMRQIMKGMMWSIFAGAAGAVGALGIILAFNYGGKPIFVMPLVFGFAPVVNTITSMIVAGSLGQINPNFAIFLLVGIAGAVTVLVFAPKAKPHGAPSSSVPSTTPQTTQPANTTPQAKS
jgi:hypothetical protein